MEKKLGGALQNILDGGQVLPMATSWKIESMMKKNKKLGGGAFGTVFRVQCRVRGEQKWYAAKMISKKDEITCREEIAGAKLQQSISNNPFINPIVKIVEDHPRWIVILMEARSGDLNSAELLHKAIYNHDEEMLKFYAACILCGIKIMHSKNIAHLDLNMSNVLRNGTNEYLELTDFGLAKIFVEKMKKNTLGFSGKPHYLSPEMAKTWLVKKAGWSGTKLEKLASTANQWGREVDFWSFGVILHIFFSGEVPFMPDADAMTHEVTLDVSDKIKGIKTGTKVRLKNKLDSDNVQVVDKDGKEYNLKACQLIKLGVDMESLCANIVHNKRDPTLLRNASKVAQDLVSKLLHPNREKRLEFIKSVHKHEWFTESNFDWELLYSGRWKPNGGNKLTGLEHTKFKKLRTTLETSITKWDCDQNAPTNYNKWKLLFQVGVQVKSYWKSGSRRSETTAPGKIIKIMRKDELVNDSLYVWKIFYQIKFEDGSSQRDIPEEWVLAA